jgi:hypothetical protein
MTSIGVFRDDYYNSISVLPQSGVSTTTQNAGTLAASLMTGAGDQYVAASGQTTAQAITTDTAANIVAALQTAIATQYKAQIAGFGAGVQPPAALPNLFNLSYTLTIQNNNTSSGAITLTGGTGVTITGTNTIAITASRTFVVNITSPTTVTLTNVAGGTA